MEFWGVEVRTGEVLKVNPGECMILHLSQACLGEMKKEKGSESVYLSVNVDGKKLVLGTLFTDRLTQQQFNLVFDRYFELSHSGKSGSVYFCGYKAENLFDDEDEVPVGESDDSDSVEDFDFPLIAAKNGKPDSKEKQVKAVENEKANATSGKDPDGSKQKVKIVELEKADETSDDEDDDDDVSGDSDEETPQKAAPSKKRAGDSAIETPVPQKKAKVTLQKTDGKKGTTHIDTPNPAKQTCKKKPGGKFTSQLDRPWGLYRCGGSCNKAFYSAKGRESHYKAEHAGVKE